MHATASYLKRAFLVSLVTGYQFTGELCTTDDHGVQKLLHQLIESEHMRPVISEIKGMW